MMRDCAFERYSTPIWRDAARRASGLHFLGEPARLVAVALRLVDAHRLALPGGVHRFLPRRFLLWAISALAAASMCACER